MILAPLPCVLPTSGFQPYEIALPLYSQHALLLGPLFFHSFRSSSLLITPLFTRCVFRQWYIISLLVDLLCGSSDLSTFVSQRSVKEHLKMVWKLGQNWRNDCIRCFMFFLMKCANMYYSYSVSSLLQLSSSSPYFRSAKSGQVDTNSFHDVNGSSKI